LIAGAAESLTDPMSHAREAEGLEWAESDFEKLFLENYPRIVAVLFRLLGDRSRAEEVANDVFWKLYRQPLALNPDGNVAGWLYRAGTNQGIDLLRAAARRKAYEHEAGRMKLESEALADPLEEVLRAEKRDRVRSVLASLKPAQAQLLILRHSGFSYNELAEVLSVNRNSVGTMLIRAEAEFQRHYIKRYGKEMES
jgi:RNA polymerase sigma factor (sigma-70 family)